MGHCSHIYMVRFSSRLPLILDAPIPPAQPTLVRTPPAGDAWIHEIKYDGYRIVAVRQGDAVHLWSRPGNDWSALLPGIREAILSLKIHDIVIDGEVVAHGAEGLQDFHGLRSRSGRRTAVLFAFDLVFVDGEDLRRLPLLDRKARLQTLLSGADERLHYVEHLEVEGRVVFKHASALGLEGIVSKRRDSPYPHGVTRNWFKTKNPSYGRR